MPISQQVKIIWNENRLTFLVFWWLFLPMTALGLVNEAQYDGTIPIWIYYLWFGIVVLNIFPPIAAGILLIRAYVRSRYPFIAFNLLFSGVPFGIAIIAIITRILYELIKMLVL